jgi:hypothetical protein
MKKATVPNAVFFAGKRDIPQTPPAVAVKHR